MKIFYLPLISLLFHCFPACAQSSSDHPPCKSVIKFYDSEFENNGYISYSEKQKIRPYLIPLDHPMKDKLDKIFRSSRAIESDDSLKAAGFITKFSQPRSYIRVASHPMLKGYLIKANLDNELRKKQGEESYRWFVRRIKLANQIREVITKKKFQHFTVPKKWIYALPAFPSPPNTSDYDRKNCILLVEDMNLVSYDENLHAWKTRITHEHLDELYVIMQCAGGSSYRADNVAFTKNGKFAFIDTEYPGKIPNYRSLIKHMAPEMAKYWSDLVTGKKRPKKT